MQTIAAAVLHCFYNLNRVLEVKTNKGLHRAAMTADELNKKFQCRSEKGKEKNSRMWTSCGGSPSISGQSQVDAAA